MKLLKTKRKSLLVTWLFSYFSIILVLFLAIIIISRVYERTINEDTNEFNNYVFENVTSSVKEVLLNISNLHLTMIRNQKLEHLVDNLDDDYYRSVHTYDVLEDMKSYNQYMVNTDALFVYAKETDKVVSHQGILDSRVYYNIYFNSEEMSYEEWKNILTNTKSDRYITMHCQSNVESIAFIFPISLQNDMGVGVILSNKKYMVEGIEKVEWKSLCDIFVYNTYGNLMIAEKRTENDKKIPTTISDVEKYSDGKRNVHISNISVNKDTWRVVTIVEKNIIFQKVFFIRYLVISVIIICSFVLAVLIVFFIKHNYHPIKIIMELFGVKERENEYEVLYENINNMINKNKELVDNTKKKDTQLKSIALSRLLKGGFQENESLGYWTSFGGEYFSVIIIEINDIKDLFADDATIQDSERRHHLRFMVDNVLEELFYDGGMQIYTTQTDGMIAGLINMKNAFDPEQIKSIATKGINFINQHFDISLTFTLSEIHLGVNAIPKAYNQAVETMKYKKVLYIESPMCYSEMSVDLEGSYLFNVHKAQSVINSIKAGKAEGAATIIKNVFNTLENDKTLALDYITFVILDILSTIAKAVNDIMPEEFTFNFTAEIYRSIKEGENLSNIFAKIDDYLSNVCDEINADIKKSKAQKRIDEIKNYVDENYMSADINVAAIGYYFDLAPSYISKIFKKSTGISMVDYINNLRMVKAQEFISEGKHSMGQISKMVGFNNERTFYRIYKKYNS